MRLIDQGHLTHTEDNSTFPFCVILKVTFRLVSLLPSISININTDKCKGKRSISLEIYQSLSYYKTTHKGGYLFWPW